MIFPPGAESLLEFGCLQSMSRPSIGFSAPPGLIALLLLPEQEATQR